MAAKEYLLLHRRGEMHEYLSAVTKDHHEAIELLQLPIDQLPAEVLPVDLSLVTWLCLKASDRCSYNSLANLRHIVSQDRYLSRKSLCFQPLAQQHAVVVGILFQDSSDE